MIYQFLYLQFKVLIVRYVTHTGNGGNMFVALGYLRCFDLKPLSRFLLGVYRVLDFIFLV